jgi:hypothetical protein
MKKLTAILAICMVAIPMMAMNVGSHVVSVDPNTPYEWVEYGEYTLSGKDMATLILTVIYEDMSWDYKGWYPEIAEEIHREIILTEISTAIGVIDEQPTNWQTLAQHRIVNIQYLIEQWVLNNGNIKDYIEWLDDALIKLEFPDDMFSSEVVPCNCVYGFAICWLYQH